MLLLSSLKLIMAPKKKKRKEKKFNWRMNAERGEGAVSFYGYFHVN